MIQSYKKQYNINEPFDSIVIGSGMGGLTTAALLAKSGQRVLVLEKHYTAGGFTHVFKRKGYEWDVGIHYIGSVDNDKSALKKIFDYVSDNKVKWADMGEVYDRIVIGEKIYNFVKGTKNFKAKLKLYFPEDKEAIDAYVDLIFKVSGLSKNFFVEKALPPVVSFVAGSFLRKPFLKYASQTTQAVLSKLTNNNELIKVLTAQFGDYGLPPEQSSFAMHAILVRHYLSGGFFPVGGSSVIADSIAGVLHKHGGAVLVSADVEEVVVENNKAIGVKMSDGKVFYAKNIISNAGIVNSYKKLLPEETYRKQKLEKQLSKINPSVAHACLYIGLNGSPEELNLPKANYWIYPEQLSHDENVRKYLKDINEDFPVVYISFPSAKDPDWSNRYPGKSTIDIITLLPYEIFQKWEDTKWMKRGEEYEKLKESLSIRLLEELYKREPALRGKVDYYELSTPLTTKHFVNYDKGEIYGIDHSPARFQQKFLKPRTPVKNFYLSGQDIVSCGVGGAAFSGVLTAGVILNKNVLKEVMK
ncbi:MAG: NAD(P)/FAD-dependent oxidoreductase [Chitinophagaceae bacterium]|nr:MAG: NAD(P)/FAD-dependent oxidoreductase [Chitinophagaceae bacterium]